MGEEVLTAGFDAPDWVKSAALEKLLDMNVQWTGHVFTNASTGDRWPSATSAAEFCENQLATSFVQAWSKEAQHYARDGTRDFSKCMHVQEALHTHGMLDFIVLIIAFVLVCFSILHERSQQLFVRHLRLMLLPPFEWRAPWKSPRTIAFKLLEILLSAMLPSVCLAMILLLFGGASLSSVDVLLTHGPVNA